MPSENPENILPPCPNFRYLAIAFLAGLVAIRGWVLSVQGLVSLKLFPLFPALLIVPLIVVLAIIFCVKKSQNRTPAFSGWLWRSSYMGMIVASFLPPYGKMAVGGIAVFWLFCLLILIGIYQSALNTTKPLTKPLIFLIIFIVFGGLAVMLPMFALPFYFALMVAMVRWVVRWFLTTVPKKDLKLRLTSTAFAVLLIESSISYQSYQLTQESEQVKEQVLAYQRQHGDYPSTQQIGKWSYTGVKYHYKSNAEQKSPPYLGYGSLFMPLCQYMFDFKTQKWNDYCTD